MSPEEMEYRDQVGAVIADAIHQLNQLNTGQYRAREYSLAITKLEEAHLWLMYQECKP
jgi:hypothetical protein